MLIRLNTILGINSLNHGAMTGRQLEEIEKVLIEEKPDWYLSMVILIQQLPVLLPV